MIPRNDVNPAFSLRTEVWDRWVEQSLSWIGLDRVAREAETLPPKPLGTDVFLEGHAVAPKGGVSQTEVRGIGEVILETTLETVTMTLASREGEENS